jgi:hypothetical protein
MPSARFGWLAISLITAISVSLPTATATAAEGDTIRVSVDSAGNQGNGASNSSDSISSDGRYIVFDSVASNLVPGDTNNKQDVFVHDMNTGNTIRVSVDSAGNQGNAGSAISSISPDGRYVAFESLASNLVPGDTNATSDVFMHDTSTGITTRISFDSQGNQGNGHSLRPSVSWGGRYVVFESDATNLVAADYNEKTDVFVHDTTTKITTRVSVSSAGGEGNFSSIAASITPDGRFVVFQSQATNLVPGDTGYLLDVFLRDTATASTRRISVNSAGGQANANSGGPSISADGRFVAFSSEASNLVPNDTNLETDAFIYDTAAGDVTRLSVNGAGSQANSYSLATSISADGSRVVMLSAASNLVANDTNGVVDAFVRDTMTQSITRVSVDSKGAQSNGWSQVPEISEDGRYVSFYAHASNLVADDTNGVTDVFVHHFVPDSAPPYQGFFIDDNGSVFENAIDAIARARITNGCNPPRNDRYCPTRQITRGEMAAFLTRALHLPHPSEDFFRDDNGSIFEKAINAIAGAGITIGCNPPTSDRFCVNREITRGEMAAMLSRAFNLRAPYENRFTDDDGHMFEFAIDNIAKAGITSGCNPPNNDHFCPDDPVTRGQMAAFLARALHLP